MPRLRLLLLALFGCGVVLGQQQVSFRTRDGGSVCAEMYGNGKRAVVLAHGGRFNKESWRPQGEVFAAHGFRVLAIDFRGFGCSHGPGEQDMYTAPMAEDVLAAVRYLRERGFEHVSVVGGSFGGAAAGDASIRSNRGEIERVVFLGSAPNLPADQLTSRSLFLVARDDASGSGPRLPGIRVQYERAPQPKELLVLDGSAHAQYLFRTDARERVMREIIRF